MTTLMLNKFVEKIIVHERDRKGSVNTTQKIEILTPDGKIGGLPNKADNLLNRTKDNV